MDEVFLVNSCSFQVIEVSSSFAVGPSVVVDLTQASVISGSFSGTAQGLTGVTASYIAPASNVTASWALTASVALNAAVQSESSSWASSSVSSSYAPVEPNYSLSVSTSLATKQNSLVEGGSYTITASWSNNSIRADSTPYASLAGDVISGSWSSASFSSSYAPVEPSYSSSVSTQFGTKQDNLVEGNTYTITASWSNRSTNSDTSSYSLTSKSSSFIIPGATFYQVSGSDGYPASYIEPYDYSKDNVFRPPTKEGRTFWDHKWVNWKVWQDTNYSGSSAMALNINLGRELNIPVHNPSNVTLTRLTPVYISGSQTSSIYPFNEIWPTTYKPDIYAAQADGTGTKSDVVGLVRNTIPPHHDGYVIIRGNMHNSDVSALGPIGTKLWLAPPGGELAYGITNVKPGQPYEAVLLGWVSEIGSGGGTQGSVIVQVSTEPAPANAYAGMTSIPTITDDTASFQVYISSGSVNLYNNTDGRGTITQYPVNEVTFSVPASLSASFIYATTNGTTASYERTFNSSDINGTTKVFVATLYRADEDTHWIEGDQEGLALANKLNIRLVETEKFTWDSGFTLAQTGSNQFTITAGSVWLGATKISQDTFDSRNYYGVGDPVNETHWAYHSGSDTWLIPTQSLGEWNNLYYDDGTSLVPLTSNYWSVNYFYRILGENPFDEDCFIIVSNNQYETFIAAQNDKSPSSIPSVLDDVAILVGRIIFQSGSTSGSVESAFTTNFGQSLTTQHNSLGGLQGGTGGQYYHMTLADYTGTGTGLMVRADAPLMSKITGSITTASYSSFAEASNTANSATSATTATSAGTATAALSASYASQSLSASYSPVEPNYSASVSSQFGTKQNNLVTGNTYTITASWAETSSWAINAINGGTQLITASTYPITSSWAEKSVSSSYAPVEPNYSSSAAVLINAKQDTLVTGNTYTITSSWSEYSTTATTAMTTNYATHAGSASYASQSLSASWAPGGTSGTTLYTASTYPITSSWAISASWAPGGQVGPTVSASWASSSISASYAPVEPIYSASVSTYFGTKQDTLITGGNYAITSSWSNNVITASYISTSFTRGGVFYDPLGLAGSASLSQNVIIWRSNSNCRAVNVWGYISGGTNSTASINARKNGVGSIATSNVSLTTHDIWTAATEIATSSFVIGDKLEITLVSSSGFPTQVAVQVDFIK